MTAITDLLTWGQNFLSTNHFASGGLLVAATGFAVATFRSAPRRMYNWLWRRFTIEVEVTSRSDLFDAVEFWLGNAGLLEKTRQYRVNFRPSPPTVINEDAHRPAYAGKGKPRGKLPETSEAIEFSAGVGVHWFFFERRLVILHRVREENKSESYRTPDERFEMSFLTRRRDIARRFFAAAVAACHPPDIKTVRVYTADYNGWQLSSVPRVRPLESLILADRFLEALTDDLRTFFADAEWYFQMGIPYRRGYLFSGPPGNGKTTTILALAGLFDAPVCVLDLAAPDTNDAKLRDLIAQSPDGAFLVLEDVDAIFTSRQVSPEQEEPEQSRPINKLTFSGLLNALDGVATPDGRIVFMTTNHPERLDPALIRPGRVDKRVEFRNADPDQARRMFLRFFPADHLGAEAFATEMGDGTRSMAQLQNALVEAKGV